MKTMRLEYPIAVLCRVFGISRSGFYAWSNGEPSPRAQADERLKVAIKAVHKQSRETYGHAARAARAGGTGLCGWP